MTEGAASAEEIQVFKQSLMIGRNYHETFNQRLHELLSHTWGASDEVVDFHWQGQRFWLRMQEALLVFKKDSLDSQICGMIGRAVDGIGSADNLRLCFERGWRHGQAVRLLALPKPSAPHQNVLVGINEFRFYFVEGAYEYTETKYSADLKGALWQISDAELRSRLMPDWNDANSLPRRAWEWHRLGSLERNWSQLVWQRGSQRELENLTRSMAHSDTKFWDKHEWWATNYEIRADGTSKVHSVRGPSFCLYKPPTRIAVLGRLFLNSMSATLQRPPLMPPTMPDRSFSPNGYAFLHLPFTAPSQHERLEATLSLRDWLQDKLAPEPIDLLVPRI